MKFSDTVLACRQLLYSLTALNVRWSPSVLTLVWESAAAPCRDPARDCVHTPQLGFASMDAAKFGALVHPIGRAGAPSHSSLPPTPSSSTAGSNQPGQPLRSCVWLGSVPLHSRQGHLTVWAERLSPPGKLPEARLSCFPCSPSRSCSLTLLLWVMLKYTQAGTVCKAAGGGTEGSVLKQGLHVFQKGLGGGCWLVAKRKWEWWTILDPMPTFSSENKTGNAHLSCWDTYFHMAIPQEIHFTQGEGHSHFKALVLIRIFIVSLFRKYICTGWQIWPYHRMAESQNGRGWKGPLWVI